MTNDPSLTDLMKGPIPTKFHREVELAAKAWTERLLRPHYRPGPRQRYVFRPGDGRTIPDLASIRHEVWPCVVTITQSIFVLVVELEQTPQTGKLKPLAEIREIARSVFEGMDAISLEIDDGVVGPISGRHVRGQSGETAWLATLRFWQNGGGVGFSLLKDDGAPSMAVKSLALAQNLSWFSGGA